MKIELRVFGLLRFNPRHRISHIFRSCFWYMRCAQGLYMLPCIENTGYAAKSSCSEESDEFFGSLEIGVCVFFPSTAIGSEVRKPSRDSALRCGPWFVQETSGSVHRRVRAHPRGATASSRSALFSFDIFSNLDQIPGRDAESSRAACCRPRQSPSFLLRAI